MKSKDARAIGWAALGMFAWGAIKSLTVQAGHSDCPICASMVASTAMDPRRLAHSVLFGPLMEEVNFRDALPRLMGDEASSVAFGAMHADPGLGMIGNAVRVLEAGLAGALVYLPAFKRGGLLGSTLVHGAHNLGAAVGAYAGARRSLTGPRRPFVIVMPVTPSAPTLPRPY